MHAKNFATPHPQFAAQAEIEDKTKGKTRKAWRKAGKKGLNLRGRVSMLICVNLLLLCLIGTGIYAISCKIHAQPTRIFSGGSATRKCHQGQKAWQTATNVSEKFTYIKHNYFSNKKLHINTQVRCKKRVVQREVFRQKANSCEQKSQKPSQVCGEKQTDKQTASTATAESKGLITPKTKHSYKCKQRCLKIRRLVEEFRQR